MRALILCSVVGSLLALGCGDEEAVRCGNQTCQLGDVCAPGLGCVRQEAAEACEGRASGEACSFNEVPSGSCRDGFCIVAFCGNGFVDQGEVCDDGNQDSGDGCSSDCRSDET